MTLEYKRPDDHVISEIQKTKELLKTEFQGYSWYRGVGIVPFKDGVRLRILVATPEAKELIPTTYHGHTIEVVVIHGVVIHGYVPRS